MAAAGQAGFDCTLFVDSNELTDGKDVTVNLKRGEIDDTARDTNGWRSRIPGLGEWSIDVTLIKKFPASTAAAALETAFYAGTIISEVKALDKNGYGLKGECSVVDFTEKQPYENVVEISVKLSGHGIPTKITPAS